MSSRNNFQLFKQTNKFKTRYNIGIFNDDIGDALNMSA